tara:strand:- start:4100 stop:4342 length:243 start_codon:yes stop_codon:yes gene_type:complete
MKKFKFDVGLVIYYEVTVTATDLTSAKEKLDASTLSVREDGTKENMFNTQDVSWNMQHKATEYFGIKDGSVVEFGETIVG